MKVLGLDGRSHAWAPTTARFVDADYGSSGHRRARALLEALFPAEPRLEEVFLPGCGLYADFYLPARRLVVEVQGVQHYEMVPFFHGGPDAFWRGVGRDHDKRAWCELNQISLAELPHDESDEQWRRRVLDALAAGG